MEVGHLTANRDIHLVGIIRFGRLDEGDSDTIGSLEDSCVETCMALSSLESPSAPKLITEIPNFLHSKTR